MNITRGIFRLLFFLCFLATLILRVRLIALWSGVDMQRFLGIRQRWTRRCLLPVLGVRVTVLGKPPDFPCILMCNHRSYLDPAVISRDVPGFPVSKSEEAGWPVIGLGAKLTGVLFIKREDQQSRVATRSAIAEKIREGFPVILFPEGTTHDLPHTMPFRPGAFKVAAEHGIPVVSVALDYRDPADYWLGKATFLPHFIACFGKKHTHLAIAYSPALLNSDPDVLLQEARNRVDENLTKIRQANF